MTAQSWDREKVVPECSGREISREMAFGNVDLQSNKSTVWITGVRYSDGYCTDEIETMEGGKKNRTDGTA